MVSPRWNFFWNTPPPQSSQAATACWFFSWVKRFLFHWLFFNRKFPKNVDDPGGIPPGRRRRKRWWQASVVLLCTRVCVLENPGVSKCQLGHHRILVSDFVCAALVWRVGEEASRQAGGSARSSAADFLFLKGIKMAAHFPCLGLIINTFQSVS